MENYTEEQMLKYGQEMFQYGKIYAEAEIGYVSFPKTKPALPQANVSGNEANQSADKKVGEVAVAFAEWIDKNNYATGTLVTKELYERFKKGKSN